MMWLLFFGVFISVNSVGFAISEGAGFSNPCNVPRAALSKVAEKSFQFSKTPIIYFDEGHSNRKLADLTTREVLIAKHGQTTVKLSSSNTYSHGLKVMSLEEYITQWVDPSPLKQSIQSGIEDIVASPSSSMETNIDPTSPTLPTTVLANESYYLFGHNYEGIFRELNTLYNVPPCKYCDKGGAKTVGKCRIWFELLCSL